MCDYKVVYYLYIVLQTNYTNKCVHKKIFVCKPTRKKYNLVWDWSKSTAPSLYFGAAYRTFFSKFFCIQNNFSQNVLIFLENHFMGLNKLVFNTGQGYIKKVQTLHTTLRTVLIFLNVDVWSSFSSSSHSLPKASTQPHGCHNGFKVFFSYYRHSD